MKVHSGKYATILCKWYLHRMTFLYCLVQGGAGYFKSENLDVNLVLPLADYEIWVKPFEPLWTCIFPSTFFTELLGRLNDPKHIQVLWKWLNYINYSYWYSLPTLFGLVFMVWKESTLIANKTQPLTNEIQRLLHNGNNQIAQKYFLLLGNSKFYV